MLRLQDAKEQRFGFRFLGEQKIAGSNLSWNPAGASPRDGTSKKWDSRRAQLPEKKCGLIGA